MTDPAQPLATYETLLALPADVRGEVLSPSTSARDRVAKRDL